MPSKTELEANARATRLETARINLESFFKLLPDNWQQTIPGTVGEAFAELRAQIMRTSGLSEVAEEDRARADLLLAELGRAAERCPRRPEQFHREALAAAVTYHLFEHLRTEDCKLLPNGLSIGVFNLLNDWAFSLPEPDQAASELERRWNSDKHATLRAQLPGEPSGLFDRWVERFGELCADVEPVVCRVAPTFDGPYPEALDKTRLALLAGLKVDDGRAGFGVYPRVLLTWLESRSSEQMFSSPLRRNVMQPSLTEIPGVPTDLEPDQWQTAWALHRDAGSDLYRDPAKAILAAANL